MIVMETPVVSVPHLDPAVRPDQRVIAHLSFNTAGDKLVAIPALVLEPHGNFATVRIHFNADMMQQELAVKQNFLAAR